MEHSVVSPSSRTGRGGRHQLKRSLSEFTSPVRLSKTSPATVAHTAGRNTASHQSHHSIYQQNHHHLPHLPHAHRREHRPDREPQTAHPGTIRHSIDMPRPDGLNASRRGSGVPLRREELSRATSRQVSLKTDKNDRLRKEIDRADYRMEGLKQSLNELHTFATIATRRLDETYYAVLEKTSSLQNTVTALKHLAERSQEIYTAFEKDSESLETEIANQLTGLGRFEAQQSKIEALDARIQTGRSRIQSLSSRVDVVRNRVESWESADQDWQNKTRRRLAVIWSAMFVVTIALVTIFWTASSWTSDDPTVAKEGSGPPVTRVLRHPSLNILRNVPILDTESESPNVASLLSGKLREVEGRLHELDEL